MPDDKEQALTALHDELVGEIVPRIIRSFEEAGGGFPQAMTVLESVICGVVGSYVVTGGDKVVLTELFAAVAQHLTEMRLRNQLPMGKV